MRIAAACGVLVAAFVVALMVGRGSGGGEDNAAASAEVKTLNVSDESMNVPPLKETGSVPDLHPKPQTASTPSTGSTSASGPTTVEPTTSNPETTGPSTGSTGGGGGGNSTVNAPPPG